MVDNPENRLFPVLYVFVRNDLDSMTPGKAEAHSGHAASAFAKWWYTGLFAEPDGLGDYNILGRMWHDTTKQGFGTQINLDANYEQMKHVVELAERLGFVAEMVHDPEYPIKDGEVTHVLPMDTAAYVFGDKNDLTGFLQCFGLKP
jgi:peptidyl-tRNA hydrolase